MFDAVKDSEKPLTEQIADQISQMIIDRHLSHGEKLPNEFELAADLKVGRGTVREAVKLLVSRNVLVIKRGRGTFVAKHPGVVDDPWGFAYYTDQFKLAQDLMEIRYMVEPKVAELAAQRATEDDIAEIVRLCDEVETMILQGEPHLAKDLELHTCIARSTQNAAVPNLIPIINHGIATFVEITQYSLSQETIQTHRMIVQAIERRDPDGAREAMLKHLDYNKERMAAIHQNMGSKGQQNA